MRIPVGIAIANAWDVLAGAELDHFMVEVVEDHGFVVEGRWHLSAQHSIHRLFPVDVSHAKRRVSIRPRACRLVMSQAALHGWMFTSGCKLQKPNQQGAG